jgi:hypothetical protein
MATKSPTREHVYGEVNSPTGLRDIFKAIRNDVEGAKSRAGLTELYRRAGYLVTLANSPAWRTKFGRELSQLERIGEEELARTARKVNARARQIDVDDDYDEKWGD